ncbi:EamA family transporter [Pseudomonas sp. CCI1.2]|uniref:EamA family transporter n=1 Tax=unclassified Pseudomonas TaxID=196821 RepID=UPI002AC8CC3F|nr:MULTISPECIES: EamA family transporter [unclassified Pseudomonas]MEB0092673.1 EamA family transporter [Pseudomonas sp. CCI4.2]MEB0122470.1 EamA family transporter [Pseudomonas sp. CCI1.2]WPX56375.1 EamA family transporter [Pseudomonas sp. CCI4.2]
MGLLTAVLWGITDVLVGINARAVGVKKAVYFAQTLGFVVMSLLLLAFPAIILKPLTAPLSVWLLAVGAAMLTVFGALALSKAFALGKASIIAPVVTSYGVVTTLLSWASGEQISSAQLACITVCVVGVTLSSRHKDSTLPHHTTPTRSIGYALLAAALYGTSFWLQAKYTLPLLGTVTTLWLGYLVGISMLLLIVLNVPNGLKIPPLKNCIALTGVSLANLAGFSAYAYGTTVGSVSVVTVISTLSGGVAAVLSFMFFRERLAAIQVVGVLLVLGGAFALHVYR